ncbi:MAG: PKD domain-containing protein [Flavobacteriales bacterium]|nr:PKD domain-containing protein [Flavobacteriales bacterium]
MKRFLFAILLAAVSIVANAQFCDQAQPGPGFPSNPTCEAAICAADPFCCSTSWDNLCASAAAVSPSCVGCLSTGGGYVGPPYCDQAQAGPGFPGVPACQTAICAADPFCCNTSWDALCASAAATNPSCVSCLTPLVGGATLVPLAGNNSVPCGTNTQLQDHAGLANYANGANGFTVLQNSGAAVITISGNYNVETNWDFINVFSGAGTGGTLIQTLTGTGTYNFTSAPGQIITVQFTSDGSIVAPGFDFAITYTGSCVASIPNDEIAGAIPVACGASVSGTTSGATQGVDENLLCGTSVSAPGVWYSVIGNGSPITVSTCLGASYDTKLNIYTGSSGSLTCIGGNDDFCGLQSSVTFNTTSGTTYWVLVQGFGGATGTFTLDVSCICPPPTISASGPTTFCNGGSVTLTSSSASGNVWNTGATSQSILVNGSGSFSVSYVDAGGCTSAVSLATVVTVNPLPVIPTISASGPTTFCAGGSVTLSSNYASGNLWSTGETTQSITVSSNQSVTVTHTDGNGCTSAASAATVVTVNPLPAAPVISASGPTTFCAGGSVTLTSNYATGNLWSNGATTQSITVSTTGSFTVTHTDGNGCTSAASAATAVTVNALPAAPVISASGPTTFCAGGSVTLTSNYATGNLWSTGETTQSITVSTNETITVTHTDGNGCTSAASAATVVTVNPIPSAPTITSNPPANSGSGPFCDQPTGTPGFPSDLTCQNAICPSDPFCCSTLWDGICAASAAASPSCTGCLSTNSNSVTVCSGTNVTLTSSFASGNLWSNGETTQSITVSTSGTFTVTHTDGNNCTSPASTAFNVTVNPTPAAPVITASGPTTFCAGGSVTLTSNYATGNLWSTGETTQSITVSSNQSVTVTHTSASGCTSAASAPISVSVIALPTAPVITITGNTILCPGDVVTLTSSYASGNQWSTGETTQSITVSTAGSYSVFFTAGSGCTSPSSTVIDITEEDAPITTDYELCQGGTVTGGLTSTLGGGSGSPLPNFSGNTSGAPTYNRPLSIAQGGACANSAVGTAVPFATHSFVAPSTGAYSFSTCGNASFDTFLAMYQNPFNPAGACAGNTFVASNDDACSLQSTLNVTLTAGVSYTLVVTGFSNTSFGPYTVVTTNPAGGGPADVEWYTTPTGGAPIANGSPFNPVGVTGSGIIDTNTPGSTTFYAQFPGGFCRTPAVFTVNANPTAPVISASGPTTFCSGGNVTLTSSYATGNLWSTGETTQSITVSTNETITVIHTDGNGCTSAASSATVVTVNPNPIAPTISSNPANTGPFCDQPSGAPGFPSDLACQNAICPSDPFCCSTLWDGICAASAAASPSCTGCLSTNSNSVTVCSGTNVTLTSSYASGNVWSNGETTQSITVSASGTFTVTHTDGNNCTSPASTAFNVTVNPTPSAPVITASGPTTFCAGGSVTLTSNYATGNLWSTGETTQSITVSTNQTITVTHTDGNGCTSAASAATVVTVNPIPAAPTVTVSGPTTICQGGSVTLTSSYATGNLWSTGETTQSITVTTNQTVTVTHTDVNSCTSPTSAATVITVNPLPVAPVITASGPTTFCAGGSVTLTSNYATGNLWSTGETTQSITVSTSQSVTVTHTDGNGCTSIPSTATTVTVNPLPSAPTISASGPTTFCLGGSVTLTSSYATGNLWSNGATTQSITVSTNGTFTVIHTDANTCTSPASASTVVTVNPNPTAPVVTASGPTTFCAGGSVTLTSSYATGNLWSTGETTQSITVTTGGSYTVAHTNANGCTSVQSANVLVIVNPTPVPPIISALGPISFCDGGSVTLTSNYTTGNLWSTGATTQSITVTAGGTYTVSHTNINGCTSSTSSIAINVNPLPSAPTVTTSGPTTFCAGGSVTLTSSYASGNLWSTGATTQSIIASTSGSYTVTYTDALGCTSLSSVIVEVTSNPIPTAPLITTSGPTAFCIGDSVTLTSNYATGNLWSTGATTQSITVSVAGTYTVIHTDANGCTSPSSAAVVVATSPFPSQPVITTSGPTTFCAPGSVTLTSNFANGNLWSNGATTQSITVTSSGTYTVVVTTASGCVSLVSEPVVVDASQTPPTPIVTVSGPTNFCQGGSVTLTSSSQTGNVWSNGETSQSIVVTTAGNYSVFVTNAAGCSGNSSNPAVVVTIDTAPNASFTVSGSSPTFTFNNTSTGGNTYTWDFGDGSPASNAFSPTHTYNQAGSFIVTLTVSNDCGEDKAYFTVIIPNTGIGENGLNEVVNLFPNPAETWITLTYVPAGEKEVTMKVYDIQGKIVMNEFLGKVFTEYSKSFDVISLAPGMYNVTLESNEGIIAVRRFIKK